MGPQIHFSFPIEMPHGEIVAAINAHFAKHFNGQAELGGPATHIHPDPDWVARNNQQINSGPHPTIDPAAVFASPPAPFPGQAFPGIQQVAPNGPQSQPVATPQQQVQQAAPSLGNVLVDKNGLPWDERIHSSNREQTDKGEWRKKRGASPDLIAQVTAQLKGMAHGGAVTQQAPQDIHPTGPTGPTGPVGKTPQELFSDLAIRIGQLIASGQLDQNKVNQLMSAWGCMNARGEPDLSVLVGFPEWIPGVYEALHITPA